MFSATVLSFIFLASSSGSTHINLTYAIRSYAPLPPVPWAATLLSTILGSAALATLISAIFNWSKKSSRRSYSQLSWTLEPGSNNLPAAVSPSEGPNHPSPSQRFFHKLLDPPVVRPTHPRSYDSLRGQSAGIWLRRKHRRRRNPTPHQRCARRGAPPPTHDQPSPRPPLRGRGLDLALSPCTSGAAGI